MMKGAEAGGWILWEGTGKEDREHLLSCHSKALWGDNFIQSSK